MVILIVREVHSSLVVLSLSMDFDTAGKDYVDSFVGISEHLDLHQLVTVQVEVCYEIVLVNATKVNVDV